MIMEREYTDNLISVIIPVYNCEKFIGRTLDSVFAQTYGNFEIVLVDDRSTDESAKIISSYCAQHDNVVYHLQEKNGGAAAARNTALELAQGRYVAFLDSDDVWKPEKTEKQMALMKEKNAFLSYTAIETMDENDKPIKKKRKVKESISYKGLLKNTMIATSSVIVDRNVTKDFRMPECDGEDYATWLSLLRGNKTAHGINEALVSYRVRKGSLSGNKMGSIREVWNIQTKLEHVNKFKAFFNVIAFCFNALKKRI